jgi:hypothetical protein
MTINTRRRYTADDIAELTAQAAIAQRLDAEVREVMAEVQAAVEAAGADYPFWQAHAAEYHPQLLPVVEAMDTDKHYFATANTSYIPEVGYFWNSRWNPATWAARNRRTQRDIANLRKALKACEVPA